MGSHCGKPIEQTKKKSCILLNPGLRLIAKLQQVWAHVFTGDSVFFLCLVYSIPLTFFFKFRQSVKYFNILQEASYRKDFTFV